MSSGRKKTVAERAAEQKAAAEAVDSAPYQSVTRFGDYDRRRHKRDDVIAFAKKKGMSVMITDYGHRAVFKNLLHSTQPLNKRK